VREKITDRNLLFAFFASFLAVIALIFFIYWYTHSELWHEVLLWLYVILAIIAYVSLCFMAEKPAHPHRSLLIIIYFICLATIVLVGLPVQWHIQFAWQALVAFYAIYGFAACVFLIYFAKGLRLRLPKDLDYYEKKRGRRL